MIAVRHYDGSGSLKVKVYRNGEIVREKATLYTANGKYYVRLENNYHEIVEPVRIMDTIEKVVIE